MGYFADTGNCLKAERLLPENLKPHKASGF